MENENKVIIGSCDSFVHTDNNKKHSITIEVSNVHASFMTYAGLSPGSNYTEVSFFGLTKDDMYELARKVMDMANSIKED